MTSRTHKHVNSKQWIDLNRMRKEVKKVLLSGKKSNVFFTVCQKEQAIKKAESIALVEAMKIDINNRRIDLLDESICDFVSDYIHTPDNKSNPLVQKVMGFYEHVTSYRITD